jgi:hypothetical protein
MKYFVDGGPAQQVTQFQPTFSQQGIGSLQQAPNIPAMEGSPTDYSAAPTQQYTPTTSYSAPAAMTAGLGSYMEGLQYKAPAPSTATTGTTSTTGTTTYNPKTQTYTGAGTSTTAPTTTPSSSTTYNPDTQTYTAPTPTAPTAPTAPTTSVNPSVNYDPQSSGWTDLEGRLMMVGDDGQFYYPAPDTGGELAAGGRIHSYAQGGSIPQGIASLGRGQDSMLVHMTPGEVQGLQRLAMSQGGSLTINPQTGLPEAGFLSAMLPMLASAVGGYFGGPMGATAAGAIVGGMTNKQSPLMGAIMGGISGYGMGSIGEGLSSLGAEQAKQLAANEAATNGANIAQKGLIASGNDAADLAFRQTVADQATANQAYQASLNDRALGIGATYNPSAYSASDFMAGEAPKDFGTFSQPSMPEAPQFLQTPEQVRDAALEHAKLDRGQFGAYLPSTPVTPQTYSPATQQALARGPFQNSMQGISELTGRGTGTASDAFKGLIGNAANEKTGVAASGLGGYPGAAKTFGMAAAPLLSSAMEPGNFNPPANKPTQYVRYGDGRTPGYTPPKYNPITGNYDPAFYGPESFYNSAQGGVVGYKQGGIADFYPLTGDPVSTGPSPGGLGNPGKKPQYSSDIYGDDSGAGINDNTAGIGVNSDATGKGIYAKPPSTNKFADTSAATLARYKTAKNAAKQAAALAELRKRANAVKDYGPATTSAAQGGLMGLNTYAAGGKLLRGPGDGMSDSIPAVINGARPQRAALADGEFVIPADVVSHLGNGSTEAGSKRLYSMMDKIRKARTGNPKQGKQINPNRFLPA